MKILVGPIGLVLFVLSTQFSNAQERGTTITISFDDVVTFEPTNGVEQSVYAVPAKRTLEERSRKVTVTDFKVMKRTRTVLVDGAEAEQEYEVKVPFTRQVTQTYTVHARPRKVLSVSEIQAWNRDGERIEAVDLAEQLEAPAAGFILMEPWPENAKIEKMQVAVLRPDVLLVFAPSLSKTKIEAKKKLDAQQKAFEEALKQLKNPPPPDGFTPVK